MNFFLLSDEKFAEIFAVALESLYTQQADTEEVRVFLIENKLSDDTKQKLISIADKFGREIEFIPMPNIQDLIGENLYIPHTLSIVDFARLFAADILPKDIDKIIELDCDIVIRHPLDELWDFNLGDNYCAMINEGHSAKMRQVLHISGDGMYYNSGVVLIDLKKWREKNIGKRSVRYIQKMHGYVPVNAQGVMNAVMNDHIALLPLKFNVYSLMYAFNYEEFLRLRCPTYYYSKKEYEEALTNPYIVHYMTCFYLDARPWMKGCLHPLTKDYLYYKSLTPWADAPLWEPVSKFTRRIYSRFCHIIPKALAIKISSFIYVDLIPARHMYMEKRYEKLGGKTVVKEQASKGQLKRKQLNLKEIQLEELKMLVEIDRICRNKDIRYSLVGGTLLGAIRHQGFIPWDDDADIGIPRPDYERFLQVFNEECSNDSYYLLKEGYSKKKLTYTRMLNHDVMIKSDILNTNFLTIDIFPIDGLPDNKKLCNKQLKQAQMLKRIIVHADHDRSSEKRFKGGEKAFAKFFHVCARCYGEEKAKRNLIALSKEYAFCDTNTCGIAAWATYGEKESYPKSGFENMVELNFEGHSFLGINCWDLYLRNLYGDYSQLPPEEKQKTHDLNAYVLLK